jgi:hypothetical protein
MVLPLEGRVGTVVVITYVKASKGELEGFIDLHRSSIVNCQHVNTQLCTTFFTLQ